MGKKKRYIQRTDKFGKKAFNFLDGLGTSDGASDSNLTDSRLDTFINTLTVVDRGNQTYGIKVAASGPGDQANGLQDDMVKLTVDGTAIDASNWLVFGAAAGANAGLYNFIKSAAPGIMDNVAAPNGGVELPVGSHTIKAQLMTENGATEVGKSKTRKVSVAQAKVDLSMVTCTENAGVLTISLNDPDLAPAATDAAAGEAAGRLPGEESFELGDVAASENSLAITVTDENGLVSIASADPNAGVNANVAATVSAKNTDITLQAPANAPLAAGNYTVTVTPRNKTGVEQPESAVTFSITVE